ncbi:MAG: hypothetical protein LBL17_04225 [Coxiellaceae bacterium]|nr:hypothetical protein [Coxiellaceae bacterium]
MKYFVELIFCCGLVLKAILFLPQAIKLYKAKKSEELSLLTFMGLNIMQILTVLHAYFHQDYILMFGVLLSLLFCGTVTCMIIIYRK